MPPPRDTFRVAVRKFGPFETALAQQWRQFCAATGCRLRLELAPLDLPVLHATLFKDKGLKRGDWDAALVVTDWLAEAHATGTLLDLAGRLRANPPEGFPGGWTESLLRVQRFGDAVLGLPYHDGPECLIYRRDWFESAGVHPPRTWEEFHALARRFTSPADHRWGAVFAAFPDGHNTVYDFCLQLWTRGGELFDAHDRPTLATPAAEEALEFYRAILTDAAAVHPRSRELDSVASGQAFVRGEVAMMVNWFGFAALGETQAGSAVKGRVALAPLPSAPGGASASLNVYWLLGVGAGSPHADLAYDFLRHCATAASDKLLTLAGAIGCRKSTWHDAEVNRVIPFYAQLDAIHAHARELPRLPHWSRLAAIIDRLVIATINSTTPVRELLAHAQADAGQLPG